MAQNANAYTMSIIAEIFARFPNRFRFTSGTRSQSQNTAVGGVANSFHLTGQAADFVAINGQYPLDERQAIKQIVANYGYELVYHNAGSGYHYHIEPAPNFSQPVIQNVQQLNQIVNTQQPQQISGGLDRNAFIIIAAGLGFLLLYRY